jgi:hypothetical protein
MEMFDFLLSVPYLDVVLGILVAGHSLATAIVNLTETPKDNELVAKGYRYIEFAAGIFNARKVKS